MYWVICIKSCISPGLTVNEHLALVFFLRPSLFNSLLVLQVHRHPSVALAGRKCKWTTCVVVTNKCSSWKALDVIGQLKTNPSILQSGYIAAPLWRRWKIVLFSFDLFFWLNKYLSIQSRKRIELFRMDETFKCHLVPPPGCSSQDKMLLLAVFLELASEKFQ